MSSDDIYIMRHAERWLAEGEIFLATVIQTWGSSPRPPGCMMAINNQGKYVGSVSGGCVEQDLVQTLQRQNHDFPMLRDYGVSREEAQRFGLPCGGQLRVLIERLITPSQVRPALDATENRKLITRHVCLNTGEIAWSQTRPDTEFTADENNIRKVFGPSWQLLIIGAGHLTRHVVQLAHSLGYQAMVCDPRENQSQDLEDIDCEIQRCMPDDFVIQHATHERCIVLSLTHEPNLDDMALMEALDSPAFYVGALGSTATNRRRRERLKALGVSEQGIARLHGPVGLPIGSRTPAEIAIAIFAEITALRHGKVL